MLAHRNHQMSAAVGSPQLNKFEQVPSPWAPRVGGLLSVWTLMHTSTQAIYSTIHKVTGLTVPGHSMLLPGTIPETLISHEWEPPAGMGLWGCFQPGEYLADGFVNSAVNFQCWTSTQSLSGVNTP